MMSIPFEEFLPIAGLAVDALLILLVGGLLVRLAKDPTKIWSEREDRLGELHDSIHLLVRQADGQARALDAELVEHTERLRALLDQAATVGASIQAPNPPAKQKRRAMVDADFVESGERRGEEPAPRKTSESAPLRQQVAALSCTGVDVEEISRRLEVPLADVRVLVALEESARARARVAHAGGQE